MVRDRGEIEATAEIVTEAVVLVFAGGSFPGAVGVTEVDFEFEVGGNLGVLGHVLSLVVGRQEAQLGGRRVCARKPRARWWRLFSLGDTGA